MCSTPNVYMFVYILIIAPIVPLTVSQCLTTASNNASIICVNLI